MYQELFAKAKQAQKKRNFIKAIEFFDEALKIASPENVVVILDQKGKIRQTSLKYNYL